MKETCPPVTDFDVARSKVWDYLGNVLGLEITDLKHAFYSMRRNTYHFYVDTFHNSGTLPLVPVPLTVAILAPNGKLYFPITNEVYDLKNKDNESGNYYSLIN